MKKIYWDFLCVCFFLHILAKNSKKISYQTAVNVSKKKRTGNYIPVITCDSNKTLLTYVYIYSKNNIYTQWVYFHAPHPFFYIFQKIPFHLKPLNLMSTFFPHHTSMLFLCQGPIKRQCTSKT